MSINIDGNHLCAALCGLNPNDPDLPISGAGDCESAKDLFGFIDCDCPYPSPSQTLGHNRFNLSNAVDLSKIDKQLQSVTLQRCAGSWYHFA